MTTAIHAALVRVLDSLDGGLRQSAARDDRVTFLELLQQGLIAEHLGSWSGQMYWVLTPKGQRHLQDWKNS